MEETNNCQTLQNLINKVVSIKQTILCLAMNYDDPSNAELTQLIKNINTEHSYASALLRRSEIADTLAEQLEQFDI